MKNTTLPIKYVSHQDFVKMLQYTVIAEIEGTFEEQIKRINNDIQSHKEIYHFVPLWLYREKEIYIKEWRFAWECSRCICVDVSTGEISYPDKYKHLVERSAI